MRPIRPVVGPYGDAVASFQASTLSWTLTFAALETSMPGQRRLFQITFAVMSAFVETS